MTISFPDIGMEKKELNLIGSLVKCKTLCPRTKSKTSKNNDHTVRKGRKQGELLKKMLISASPLIRWQEALSDIA